MLYKDYLLSLRCCCRAQLIFAVTSTRPAYCYLAVWHLPGVDSAVWSSSGLSLEEVRCQKVGERAAVRVGDVRGRSNSKVRSGQVRPSSKRPLSPGSSNPTSPLYLVLPLNYFQQTEVNQNNPAFCPGFGSGSWLHSGKCPQGQLVSVPARVPQCSSLSPAQIWGCLNLTNRWLMCIISCVVCPGRAACLRVGVMTKEGTWGSCAVLLLCGRLKEPTELPHLLSCRVWPQEGSSGLASPKSQLRSEPPGPESCTLAETRGFWLLAKRNQVITIGKLAQQFLLKLQLPARLTAQDPAFDEVCWQQTQETLPSAWSICPVPTLFQAVNAERPSCHPLCLSQPRGHTRDLASMAGAPGIGEEHPESTALFSSCLL